MIALLLDQGDPGLLPVVEMLALQGLAATSISGSRVQEASLHTNLAAVARARENHPQETGHLQRAHALLGPAHPVAEQAATRLTELGEPCVSS